MLAVAEAAWPQIQGQCEVSVHHPAFTRTNLNLLILQNLMGKMKWLIRVVLVAYYQSINQSINQGVRLHKSDQQLTIFINGGVRVKVQYKSIQDSLKSLKKLRVCELKQMSFKMFLKVSVFVICHQ